MDTANQPTPAEVRPDPDTPAETGEDFNLAEYRKLRNAGGAEAHQPEDAAEDTPDASEADTPSDDESEADSGSDTDPEQQDEAEEEEQPAEGERKKGKGGFQRRITKLAAENARLKAQLAGNTPAAKPNEQQAPPQPQAPAYDKPKPKLEDFDSIEAYTEAHTDWKLGERDFQKAQNDRAATQQTERKKIADAWNASESAVKVKYADYQASIEAASDIQLTPGHQMAIVRSSDPAELSYQLSKHRDELARIAALDPVAAAVEIGRFAERHVAKPAHKPATRISGAPSPIRPVGGKSPVVAINADTSDFQAYKTGRLTGRIR